jgi:undecaprenyl-diphosphatase
MTSFFNTLNYNIFYYINSAAGKSQLLDTIMLFFAITLPYIYLILYSYLYFIKKKRKLTLDVSILIILTFTISTVINFIYFHPRPFMVPVGMNLLDHEVETSFPSSHTLFYFALTYPMIYHPKHSKLFIILLLSSLIGGIARVFCGVHFPMDIIGGLFLPLALLYPSIKISNYIFDKSKEN